MKTAFSPKTMGWAVAFATVFSMSHAGAQDLKEVPRNRTLISSGWEYHNQVPSPTNLNPYLSAFLHQRNSLHYTATEFLFYANRMTGDIVPWQAESYSYNDALTELTIKIRDGVTWADGKPFTAEDVVFTLDLLKSTAPKLLLSPAVKDWVANVEALDPLTVKITLSRPGPRFLRDMLADGTQARLIILPKHVWEGQDPTTFNFFDLEKGWPLGTGPYKLVKSDSGSMIYDRRDEWWAVKTGLASAMPEPERVIYRPATVEALPQLYTSNEIDVGRNLPVGSFEAAKARNPALVTWNDTGPVWGAPDGCTVNLVFNSQKKPFSDSRVRRSFNSAINRAELVDLAYEGSMPTATLPYSSYGGMLAYTDKIADLAPQLDKYDPAQIDQLLEPAGFKKINGVWAHANGDPWPIVIGTLGGNAIAPIITEQLKRAGYNATFQVLADATYYEAIGTGNFETALVLHCGSVYDPYQTLQYFHGKLVPDEGKSFIDPRGIYRYKNPELDAILDKMEQSAPSADNPEYMKLVRSATEIFVQDMPEITLAENVLATTFSSAYWTGWPSASDPYIAPYIPWEGFALVIHKLKAAQ